MGNYPCVSCRRSKLFHASSWADALASEAIPTLRLSGRASRIIDNAIEKFLVCCGVAWYKDAVEPSLLQPRSAVFLEEMGRRGASFKFLHSFAGFTNRFSMTIGGRRFCFEGLPGYEFEGSQGHSAFDDKQMVKKRLSEGGFPTVAGRVFWWQQKGRALAFARQLGYPLVVKPRNGSGSRHVTTDIRSEDTLKEAIGHALEYSPSFLIERYVSGASLLRATVIDADFVACVMQVPAHVEGDGVSTVRELIDRKNDDPRRQNRVHYHIVEDETMDYNLVPAAGQRIYFQRDPFLKLGGDVVEVTESVHPDTIAQFQDIARHFKTTLTGIDFLIPDIGRSWKEQQCAVLELNSLPCIELHHFPYAGTPTDPAGALADMFEKYYLDRV